MIFNLDELPKSNIQNFIDFCKGGKPFNEVYSYFKEKKLHQLKDVPPVVYIFKNPYNKFYVGKAENIIERIQSYFTLNKSYVNPDLKDDLMFEGHSYFTFAITTNFNKQLITNENLLTAENWITSNYHLKGYDLYNKINKKRKLEIRTAQPAKSLKSKYKKLGPCYKDIDEIFGGFNI